MVEQVLGRLFGGQDDDDESRRRGRARDFVGRYEAGAPGTGISPEEAYHNYRFVAGWLSAPEYEAAAAEAFERMTPQDRAQLADTMRQHGNVRIDGPGDDPRQLAHTASRFRQQSASGFDLGDLFGPGGRGDLMSNPLATAALGGIAAMAVKRTEGR
jgi:hypothetical protein